MYTILSGLKSVHGFVHDFTMPQWVFVAFCDMRKIPKVHK